MCDDNPANYSLIVCVPFLSNHILPLNASECSNLYVDGTGRNWMGLEISECSSAKSTALWC